jgi:hypothetical protein
MGMIRLGDAEPVRRLPTIVVLDGPTGTGKSWVADQRCRPTGGQHVDADWVILDRLDRDERPDPRLGWLEQVETAVRR